MSKIPESVARFLSGSRFAVAGVSRDPNQPANAIYRTLVKSGYEVVPVNPQAAVVEGVPACPDLLAIPGRIDGVVFAAHPRVASQVVRECKERGIPRIWFHRAFGQGSVSDEAVREGRAAGIDCIVGGCPLMYCRSGDLFHRCMRFWFDRRLKSA